jgi:hypothetical protein
MKNKNAKDKILKTNKMHIKTLLKPNTVVDTRLIISLPQSERPNINTPRYNQHTYHGRAQHFIEITNPMNIFINDKMLLNVQRIVNDYRFVCMCETEEFINTTTIVFIHFLQF